MNENLYQCSKCKSWIKSDNIWIVDGVRICSRCMYGDIEPIKIYPIGIVRNKLQRTRTRFMPVGDQRLSRIELNHTQEPFLYKLDEEKFITIVYYFHKAGPIKSTFKRGLDGKRVGVFASRTPDRLSKIGIQDVTLIKIEKTTLYVKGLDAINGSPVLDIKLKRSAIPETSSRG